MHLGDLVLEAGLIDVGQRHVAGIGTHDEPLERLLLVHLLGRPLGGGLFGRRQLVERLLHVADAQRRHGSADKKDCTEQQVRDATYQINAL